MAENNGRQRGRLKWFDPARNFGFIISETGGDIFVHQGNSPNAHLDMIQVGQAVTFTMQRTKKGLKAFDVELDAG